MNDIALAVMRLQPLHIGHEILISAMLKASSKTIIALGSSNEQNTPKNPFSFEKRCEMLRAIFPDVIIVRLIDINASSKDLWAKYVLEEVQKQTSLTPTIYYAGSTDDASWFEGFLPLKVINRQSIGKGINATEIRQNNYQKNISPKISKLIKEAN